LPGGRGAGRGWFGAGRGWCGIAALAILVDAVAGNVFGARKTSARESSQVAAAKEGRIAVVIAISKMPRQLEGETQAPAGVGDGGVAGRSSPMRLLTHEQHDHRDRHTRAQATARETRVQPPAQG